MKFSIWVLLLALLLVIGTTSQALYKKIAHNLDPEARCLDGSLPAIYLNPNPNPSPDPCYPID